MPVIFKPIESKYFSKKIFCEFIGNLIKEFVDLNVTATPTGDFEKITVVLEGETFSLGDSDQEGSIYITFDENSTNNRQWLAMNKYDNTGQFWLDFDLNIKLKREKTSPFRMGNIQDYLIQAVCFNTNSNSKEIPYSKTLSSAFGSKTLKTSLLMNKVVSTQTNIDEVYITNTIRITFAIEL